MKFTQPPLINMLPIWGTSSPSADVIKVLSLHCIEIEWREYRNSCLGSMVCLDLPGNIIKLSPTHPMSCPIILIITTVIALILCLKSLIFLPGGAEWKFIRRHQKVQKLQGEGERWRAGESQVQSWRVFSGLHECHFISCCAVNALLITEHVS